MRWRGREPVETQPRRLRVIADAVVFEDELGQRWLRTGECNRCGDCCFGTGEEAPEVQQSVEGKCSLYRQDGELGGCAGHGSHPYWVGGCANWPSRPSHVGLLTRCSYRFQRLT